MSVTPWYNVSVLSNHTGVAGIFQTANDVTYGWFGILICLGIFIVTFVATIQFTPKKSVLVAGIVAGIASIIMRALNLVSEWIILVFMVLVALGIIMNLNWSEY
jgi:hypothetical protein